MDAQWGGRGGRRRGARRQQIGMCTVERAGALSLSGPAPSPRPHPPQPYHTPTPQQPHFDRLLALVLALAAVQHGHPVAHTLHLARHAVALQAGTRRGGRRGGERVELGVSRETRRRAAPAAQPGAACAAVRRGRCSSSRHTKQPSPPRRTWRLVFANTMTRASSPMALISCSRCRAFSFSLHICGACDRWGGGRAWESAMRVHTRNRQQR